MKKFDFKLQSLLSYRNYLERLAQQRVAKAQMDLLNCENRIRELENRYESGVRGRDKEMSAGVTAQRFHQHCQFLDQVDSAIKNQVAGKGKLKKLLAEKIVALKKHSIDKQVIERLKDRRIKEFQQAYIKNEQLVLDEIASLKKSREVQEHENE